MRYKIIEEKISIPDGIDVKVENDKIIIKGPLGSIERKIDHPKIIIKTDKNSIILSLYFSTRREERYFYTLLSHIKNAIEGVKNGFRYKLKAVYVHFPFKMKIQDNKFIIENFLGERSNREVEIPKDIKVKIEGDFVIVEGYDLEKVGNFAGLLESLTRIREKDLRKFQDGLYIIEKP